MAALVVDLCRIIKGCICVASRATVAVAVAAIIAFLAIIQQAEACEGCGCRGGPGYRGPNGRCVSWAQIGRICGSPPTSRCVAEGPNAGADEAARQGQTIQRLKDAAGKAGGE